MVGKLLAMISVVLFPVYRFAIRRQFYIAAAVILWVSLIRLEQRGQKKLLFLDRSIFRADIEAMSRLSQTIDYVGIQRKYLWAIFETYIDRSSTSETSYHEDHKLLEARKKLFAGLDEMFGIFQRFVGFDGIITCNFGYLDQQELFEVARTRGWPFIVLYKEGMLPVLQLENLFEEYVKKQLNCSLLLTANSDLGRRFSESKIPGKDRTRIVPVGIPRLDVYKEMASHKSGRSILLLSFLPEDKMRFSSLGQREIQKIAQIGKKFHKNLIRLATERPDLNIVIKTKVAVRYLDYVHELAYSEFSNYASLPNLSITNQGSATECIKRSSHVIGSQSTGLVEGLLANRRVGRPRFPSEFELESDFLYGYEKMICSINTFSDLVDFVDGKAVSSNRDLVARGPLMRQLIFTTEYDASQLAEKEIRLEMSPNRPVIEKS